LSTLFLECVKTSFIMTSIPILSILFLSTSLLTGCNEPPNPLVGHWEQISPATQSPGHRIEFTPSTMRINDRAVTVVYQMRDNKIRVSASKSAIIYEFDDQDSIHYEDEINGTIKLIRVQP